MSKPEKALQEMWRVSRKGVMLGLLNRNSLLYRERDQHPGYLGARWDNVDNVRQWAANLSSQPTNILIKSAVFVPTGATLSRMVEKVIPAQLPFGSFLAVYLQK